MLMWVTIKDFPNFEINEHGVVRNAITHYVTKQRMNPGGYLYVEMSKDGKNYTRLVHRLVAIAFIPNPNNYPIVNHIDECSVHNDVSNLEWVTYASNSNHATRNKRIIQNRRDPVIALDSSGNIVARYESKHEAARQLHVTEAAIRASISRKCRCKSFYFVLEQEPETKMMYSQDGDTGAI